MAGLLECFGPANTPTANQDPDIPPNNANVTSSPIASRSENPGDTVKKRVSFAALPMPAREDAITGNGHINGLTNYSFDLNTPPRTSGPATGMLPLFSPGGV